MKINDVVPVTIAGQVVANAVVRELGDGTATLVFPATRVVMAVRTELAVEDEAPMDSTGTETIITGVDRDLPERPESPAEKPVESAAVDESSTNNEAAEASHNG